jgi:hypothetical protein
MDGDEATRSALSSSSFDDGISFLATGNGNMTPAYLAAARCVAELMPGPARAALTLLRRTGTVHDFRTPPRGVSAKMSTEKLSFRGCGTYSKKVGVIPSPSTHRSAQLWTRPRQVSTQHMEHSIHTKTMWWLRHSICASCTDLHPNSYFCQCMESVQHEPDKRKFS